MKAAREGTDGDEPCALFAVTADRKEWLDRAERLQSAAADGHSRNAHVGIGGGQTSSPRGSASGSVGCGGGGGGGKPRGRKHAGPLTYVPGAPSLHLEAESDLHIRSAEAYRICGDRWRDAAEEYGRAATVQSRGIGCPETAAALCAEAAICAERSDPREAVGYYARAISLYCEVEKYRMAGQIQMRIAQIFDDREHDVNSAVRSYERASRYFLAASAPGMSHNVLERAAYLMGTEPKRHREASDLYASLGKDLTESNLTKRSAVRMYFRSGLLFLALISGTEEWEKLQGRLQDFCAEDHHFGTSRECAFLEAITEAVRSEDLEGFADHVYHYDTICPLDTWCMDLLDWMRSQLENSDKGDNKGDESPQV